LAVEERLRAVALLQLRECQQQALAVAGVSVEPSISKAPHEATAVCDGGL
jgi:hypothetical protein